MSTKGCPRPDKPTCAECRRTKFPSTQSTHPPCFRYMSILHPLRQIIPKGTSKYVILAIWEGRGLQTRPVSQQCHQSRAAHHDHTIASVFTRVAKFYTGCDSMPSLSNFGISTVNIIIRATTQNCNRWVLTDFTSEQYTHLQNSYIFTASN